MNYKLSLKFILLCFGIGLCIINNNAYSQNRYLIVLDVQEFPKKDKQQESSVREMILNVNTLISHFNPEKVIYIKAAGKAISITSKGFKVVTLPAPDFDSSLHVVCNNIIIKTEGDAFTSAELTAFLQGNKPEEIVLTGLMADKCIYNTALGGLERGYHIKIVTEAIVGSTQKEKDKAVAKMKDKGVEFIQMNEMINAFKR